MKVCVFGAGAVGGNFAARLSRAGEDVSIIARGAQLEAVRASGGVRLEQGAESFLAPVKASGSAAELGPQDVVLVTLKATGLAGLPGMIAPLLGAETLVVFCQNGIPWWHAIDAPASPSPTPDLAWLDPGGELASLRARAIGAVIYSANEVVAPGHVRNNTPGANRLVVGELDERATPRLGALRAMLERAGIASPDQSIRAAMWSKLVMNISSSVLSAVAERPASELRLADPAFEAVFQRLHGEAVAIASAHCAGFAAPPFLKARPGHTPSLLQDLRLGRAMEIDVLVAAPLAFARAAGLATPTLDALGALLAEKAERAGLYKPTRPLAVEAAA